MFLLYPLDNCGAGNPAYVHSGTTISFLSPRGEGQGEEAIIYGIEDSA
jgi:hypothetical protein